MIASCATKTIQSQNFSGDIQVSSFSVKLESLDLLDTEHDQDSIFSRIKKANKIIQDLKDAFSQDQSLALNQQLVEFQKKTIAGLRSQTGLPLVISPDATPDLVYGTSAELESITFDYPSANGPTIDLSGEIVYVDKTTYTLTAGETLEGHRLKVRPQLSISMTGTNRQGDTFWNESFDHTSRVSYILGNNYVFGVPTQRIEDKEIFLLPLAEGLTSRVK